MGERAGGAGRRADLQVEGALQAGRWGACCPAGQGTYCGGLGALPLAGTRSNVGTGNMMVREITKEWHLPGCAFVPQSMSRLSLAGLCQSEVTRRKKEEVGGHGGGAVTEHAPSFRRL